MDKEPKDFQLATAKHIVDIFKQGKQRKVLLSDEVGLGKTIVSKEVIHRIKTEMADKVIGDDGTYRVVYVCSNVNIVEQNTENLGINEVMKIDEGRLSMQHLIVQEKIQKMNHGDEILIPLTPGTSFNLDSSAGNLNERALLYVFLRQLPDFKDYVEKLKRLLNTYNANSSNWQNKINEYQGRVDQCGNDYNKDIIQAILSSDIYGEAKMLMLEALNAKGFEGRNKAISKFRLIACHISMNHLNPDLVILDEFQRFSSLLDTDENNEESLLARTFFGQEDGPMVLLVSATPYKPLTTLEELNETKIDKQYEDFTHLMDFLFKDRKDISFKPIWQDYSRELCHIVSDRFDILVARKKEAEDAMYKTMSRTERFQIRTNDNICPLDISPDDVVSYCQMQSVIDDCNEATHGTFGVSSIPIDYVKSSPYLLSFMDRYVLKRSIEKVYRNRKLPVSQQKQKYLIKVDDIYKYKEIDPCNARLASLEKLLFDRNGERLLWIPASHPYYKIPASNVFAKNSDFSKILVFSSWEMVPRMIAGMVSYTAEQKNISNAFPAATYTNKKESEELDEINKEQKANAGVGRLRTFSLELITYPSVFLSKFYDPTCKFGDPIKEVRNEVRTNILNDKRIKEVDKKQLSAEDLVNALKELDANNTNKDSNVELNSDDIDIFVDMAIASPAVCYYRILKDQGMAQSLAKEIAALFNRRQNAAAIDLIYNRRNVQRYYEQVLDYCVMGNLQSVLDEFASLIDERPIDKRDASKISKRMMDSFADMGSVDIDTTNSFAKDKNEVRKWSVRTHYAMPFAKIQTNEKSVNRANDVRKAFNSPFRPFVLASTSVGQEGLDFHWYCRKIMHWNIPSNAQDLEQREGRINRYKSLSIRRNVAKLYPEEYLWSDMYDKASQWAKENGKPELVPFWSLPDEMLKDIENPEHIERIVPMYPLSSDVEKFSRIKAILALYRLTIGQPRQEELIGMLKDLNEDQRNQLMFNLSPIFRRKS